MRIAVVSTPVFRLGLSGLGGYGGLEQVAWERARGLARKGHQVTLIAPDGSECEGCQVVHCGPAGRISEKDAFSRYWECLLKQDCIIDDSWQKWSYNLKMEGRLDKTPILGVCHAPIDTMFGMPNPKEPHKNPLWPGVKHLCMVCISEDHANSFRYIHKRDVRVAYNGCSPEIYRPLGIPRKKRYLFLARFSIIKGPHLAIEACKKVGAGLDLIGDTTITNEPDCLKKCRMMADSEGALTSPDDIPEKAIHLWGGVSRAETIYFFNRSHALLHPVRDFAEPFGLSPIEGMLCGVPCISWKNGAMPETIREGVSGWLVTSEQELEDRIRDTYNDGISDQMRKDCRDWAAERFSLQKMVDRYVVLCEEAVKTGGW